MRYMMLIHHDEAALAAAPQKELWADFGAFNEALSKAGLSGGERLQSSSAATTVRQEDGKSEVLDGPYADTKEQLAGFYMIEAADIDTAIEWAARCPAASTGTVELRPIWEMADYMPKK